MDKEEVTTHSSTVLLLVVLGLPQRSCSFMNLLVVLIFRFLILIPVEANLVFLFHIAIIFKCDFTFFSFIFKSCLQ